MTTDRFALAVLHTTHRFEVYRLTDGKHVRAQEIIKSADMVV